MKSSAKKVELASVDDLFSTEKSRQEAALEKVQNIPLSDLYPLPDHPFSVHDNDDVMKETLESVKERGIINGSDVKLPDYNFRPFPRRFHISAQNLIQYWDFS